MNIQAGNLFKIIVPSNIEENPSINPHSLPIHMGVSPNQLTSTHFNLFGWSFIWQLNVLYGIFRLPYWETWYRWGKGTSWSSESAGPREWLVTGPCCCQCAVLVGIGALCGQSFLGKMIKGMNHECWVPTTMCGDGFCFGYCFWGLYIYILFFFRFSHLVVAELMCFGLIWSTQCCGEQRGPWFFDAQTQMFQFEYGIYVNGMDQICIIKSLRLHFSAPDW